MAQHDLETRVVVFLPPMFEHPTNRVERSLQTHAHYERIATDILGRLAGQASVSVRNLTQTGTLIISAPRATWATLLSERGPLDDPRVEVRANEPVNGT